MQALVLGVLAMLTPQTPVREEVYDRCVLFH